MADTEKSTRPVARRAKVGLVRSISGSKTINVTVNTLVKHPRYGKFIRRRSKVVVHDPNGLAQVGDLVEIVSCRRLSKSKAWRLTRVVRPRSIAEFE